MLLLTLTGEGFGKRLDTHLRRSLPLFSGWHKQGNDRQAHRCRCYHIC